MPTVREDHWSGWITYLNTGISDLGAAKKYLRNKFRQRPLEPIQQRPGHRFYVSVKRGPGAVLLLGPYVSHMTALANVPRGRSLIGRRASFAAVGTCSSPLTHTTRFGR